MNGIEGKTFTRIDFVLKEKENISVFQRSILIV